MIDNIDIYYAHEAAEERYRRRLPLCACCREPIMSENAYKVDGWYCEDCFHDWVDDIRTATENLEGEW